MRARYSALFLMEVNMECWECGKPATHRRRIGNMPMWAEGNMDFVPEKEKHQRCYCKDCFEKKARQQREENELFIKLKKRRMYETALDILEHQKIKMYDYQEAAKAVQEFLEDNPDKFDSSYEILAAIILIKHKIKCKMQYKIGSYQVDMLLPDLFVALEIDGDRHEHRKKYDSERDMTIKMMLGSQWEIIRIKTDYLDQHADRLLDAIKKVCDYRAFKEY